MLKLPWFMRFMTRSSLELSLVDSPEDVRKLPGWTRFKVYIANTIIAPSKTSEGCFWDWGDKFQPNNRRLTEIDLSVNNFSVPSIHQLDCSIHRTKKREKHQLDSGPYVQNGHTYRIKRQTVLKDKAMHMIFRRLSMYPRIDDRFPSVLIRGGSLIGRFFK